MSMEVPLPWPVEINLSRSAMDYLVAVIEERIKAHGPPHGPLSDVACEVDNFVNLLQNLLDRSEPEPGNLDLIGD